MFGTPFLTCVLPSHIIIIWLSIKLFPCVTLWKKSSFFLPLFFFSFGLYSLIIPDFNNDIIKLIVLVRNCVKLGVQIILLVYIYFIFKWSSCYWYVFAHHFHFELRLNVEKCFIMSFHRKVIPLNYNYNIGRDSLVELKRISDLGETLDPELKFTSHCMNIKNTAFKNIDFFLSSEDH